MNLQWLDEYCHACGSQLNTWLGDERIQELEKQRMAKQQEQLSAPVQMSIFDLIE